MTNSPRPGWTSRLINDRSALKRSSTAERVADLLQARITEGLFPPGTRLSEEELGRVLGISRNTLREAFRLLVRERLLVHELNRGVFVRTLTAEDVEDLYRMRKLLECGAIRDAGEPTPVELQSVHAAMEEAEAAAAEGRWLDVGTAHMRFHQAVVGLARSVRMADTTRQVLAELRLVFGILSSHREFHEPYLQNDRQIYHLLAAGDTTSAALALESYLDTAQRQLIGAMAAVESGEPRPPAVGNPVGSR